MAQTAFWIQFKALVWKNFLLKKRNKKQTFQEVLMPIYFIAILAMIKYFVKPNTFPEIPIFPAVSLHNEQTFGAPTGKLLVTPDSTYSHGVMTEVTEILQRIYQNSSFQVLYFNSTDDAVSAYKSYTSDKVLAGIIFNYDATKAFSNLSYALRVPFSKIASSNPSDLYTDQSQCRSGSGLDVTSCGVNTYIYTGFAAVQSAVDTALLRVNLNKTIIPANISVQMMPKPGYIPNTNYIQILSSLYFIIAYSPFINFLTVNLVAEKEKKIKEGMKMMGLKDSAFWLSWGFVYTVIIILVTVVVIVIAAASQFFIRSNMFLFFLMLVLYGLSIIGTAFSLTPFFNQAQVAGGIASLASMLISLLYLIVSLTRTYTPTGVTYTIPVWGRWLLCLLSPVALALAIDQAIYLDIVNPKGMTFSTLNEGEFPLYGPLLMLVVDTVLYFLLALYLDNVIPGEYGPRQPPWYIFMPSYWCRSWKRKPVSMSVVNPGYVQHGNQLHLVNEDAGNQLHFVNQEEELRDSEKRDVNVEKVSDELSGKVAVNIVRLTKEFPGEEEKITAVNKLSLDIYEDQITALLGHNGAGKTTTMNILTGLTGPTSGAAHIMGLDVSNASDMAEIRSMTGVCPQHNILFEDLTCLEHLQLFAGIKGLEGLTRDKEIEDALNSVGLAEQRDVRSVELSGGQKRKLSVAIAIIGDPKIIFLDEPTAGMDPYSRRHLWSVLKEKKKGRVILLTTHFMDEADILADRKAIINKGSLRCCGSSLFLKNRFGIGYHLNMVVSSRSNTEAIKTFVSGYVPGSDINRSHGQEVDIMLPMANVSQFAGLFNVLEKEIADSNNDLGILSYGISMTTLEEVFLELEKETDPTDLTELGHSISITQHEANQSHSATSKTDSDNRELPTTHLLLQGTALVLQRYKALLKIRLLNNMRNRQLLFYQLLLPILFVVIGLLVNKNIKPDLEGENPKSLDITAYYYSQMKNIPPFVGPFVPAPPLLVHDMVDSALSTAFLGNLSTYYTTDNFSDYRNVLNAAPHYLGINLTEFTSSWQGILTNFTALYNDSAVHAIPSLINLMTNSIFKMEESMAGRIDNSTYISTSSLPWPTNFQSVTFNNAAFSSIILLAMAFTVIPAGFGIDIVRDRQTKVRSQLRISGVSFNVYWGASITLDIVKYIIPAVLIIVIALIIQVPSLQHGGAYLVLLLLCLTYIPANLLLSYVLSFAFDKWETAQAVEPLAFFFGGFMPYLPVALVDSMTSESTASLLHIIFCIAVPPYTIFGGIFYIDKVFRVAQMQFSTESISLSSYFSSNIVAAILLPLAHVILFGNLLRVLDVKETGGSVKEALSCFETKELPRCTGVDLTNDATFDEDDDVRNERQRVAALMKQPDVPVAMVSNLSKEFSKSGSGTCCKKKKHVDVCVAVHKSSFAVDAGEVFGLLGPNGAGKSTTLNMMTADVGPTEGEVIIGGNNVRSSRSDAFNAMGFCPQHDALWDKITLMEHLECYAKVKGIHQNQIKSAVEFYMENLQLSEHSNKRSKKLSGGTKRKLSYCMSMLGDPKVVLLDEPSTGMDPQSKRFLWDTISSGFKGSQRGAILTTHYMEEADALCSRIAIMVNGKLQCIGSSQHLKSKYGSGYLLEIKLQTRRGDQSNIETDMANMHQYVTAHFPGAICVEEFSERAQFKIPRDNVTSLAKAFTVLEEAKLHHNVEEYSFSQSTLEQVFLDFAKRQIDAKERAISTAGTGSL